MHGRSMVDSQQRRIDTEALACAAYMRATLSAAHMQSHHCPKGVGLTSFSRTVAMIVRSGLYFRCTAHDPCGA